jgi:hypothetical protein
MPPVGRHGQLSGSTPMIELMVLIRLTASAPPALAARAGLADVGDVGRQLDDHRQLL